jgi:DMSO/TMAO reductase YedYZ molybdopterin-dependent catalytic subunit
MEQPENQKQSLALGAVLGAITILPLIGLSYLGSKLADLPFIPFDVFDWLARVLPGNVITLGIDMMVRAITLLGVGPISATAKSLEQLMGMTFVVMAGAVFGVVLMLAVKRIRTSGNMIGAGLGVVAFLIAALIELNLGNAIAGNVSGSLIWLAILFVSWGALLGSWFAAPALVVSPLVPDEEPSTSRRDFLIKIVAGSVGVAIVASGLGKLLAVQQQASGSSQALSNLQTPQPTPAGGGASAASSPTPSASATAQATLRDQVPVVPGTRPEITPVKLFYRTDIDTLPPVVEKASWKLKVTGLFDHARDLTLDDFLAYPPTIQPITLSCISNPIGGDLISTGNWIGVQARNVLKDLGLRSDARALAITAVDGFYESVPLEDLMDPRTLFVYGMDGETLTTVHGFPLRIYIPNRYGMKQPKWIIAIEAIDHDGPGYWVDRGWSATAYPQIVSVIDVVAKDHIENNRVPVGGIAWAGDRGIKKVELQVDNGEWLEATLRTPPLGPLTWVQWRFDWPVVPGSHQFRVRATDGTGALQIEKYQDTYPDGATGYHTVKATF